MEDRGPGPEPTTDENLLPAELDEALLPDRAVERPRLEPAPPPEPPSRSTSDPKPFKVRELRTYASYHVLAGNGRRYRFVYDLSATRQLCLRLGLYNLELERTDWARDFVFRVEGPDGAITESTVSFRAEKWNPAPWVRDEWGARNPNSPRGRYTATVLVDGEVLASTFFYLEKSDPDGLPLDFHAFRLFAGKEPCRSPSGAT